jgi:hypothetical protein
MSQHEDASGKDISLRNGQQDTGLQKLHLR